MLLAGYVIAWVASLIPIIRWFIFSYIIIVIIEGFPASVDFSTPITFILWGMLLPFIRILWKKLNLSFPRLPRFRSPLPTQLRHNHSFVNLLRPKKSPFAFIAYPFKWIWRIIKGAFYFLLVRIPARLIRLGFWIKQVIPSLNTWDGWKNLIKGLFSWLGNLIWIALPAEIRAEFRRGTSGKEAKESFAQDVKSSFYREQTRQKKRDEQELWRFFNSFKKTFQQKAREGHDPFKQGEPDLDPKKQAQNQSKKTYQKQQDPWENDPYHDNDFYREQQASAQRSRNRRKKESETQKTQSSKQSNSSRQSSSSQKSNQTNDPFPKSEEESAWWKEQQSRTSQESAEQKRKESQNSKQSTQSKTSKTGTQPTTDPPSNPASKAYYDKYRNDFIRAGWNYEPDEERFTGGKNSYDILQVTTSQTSTEIKKSYYALSKKYRPFLTPTHPTTVQKRANEIIKEINRAHNTINPRKKKK